MLIGAVGCSKLIMPSTSRTRLASIEAPPGVRNTTFSDICANFIGDQMIYTSMLDFMSAVVYQDYHRDPERQSDQFLTLGSCFGRILDSEYERKKKAKTWNKETLLNHLAKAITKRHIRYLMWYQLWDYHFGAVVVDISKKLVIAGESMHNQVNYRFPDNIVKAASLLFPLFGQVWFGVMRC